MLLLAILSRKMMNLFENFVRVLEKYFENVCLFFEYLGCLIFLWGCLIILMSFGFFFFFFFKLICFFYFFTKITTQHRQGELNLE